MDENTVEGRRNKRDADTRENLLDNKDKLNSQDQ